MDTTTMMGSHTITALFDSRSDATKAVDELVEAGISRSAIRVTPETDVTTSGSTTTAYDTSADDKGFWASLKDLFIPDEDRYTYAEAMHRGGVMVSVSADEELAAEAEDILERRGTVDVDEREASWRKEGWSGYSGSEVGTRSGATSSTAGAVLSGGEGEYAQTRDVAEGEEAIPEVEEQLRVGKRQVNSGRVKVRSYVVETPVSEQVNLRSETVHVERRPVDRAVSAGEDAFKERTIEAVATSEEAVISKEARVTGEVLVRKEATDETQTVTDKVRSTKVEVEDDTLAGERTTTRR